MIYILRTTASELGIELAILDYELAILAWESTKLINDLYNADDDLRVGKLK